MALVRFPAVRLALGLVLLVVAPPSVKSQGSDLSSAEA
jgi:hypothetical protein